MTVIQRFGGGLLFDGVFHTPDEGDTLDTLDPSDADLVRADPVREESPALAGISSASIQGRIALGSREGARVWRVGDDPNAPWVLSTAPQHAHLTGFDLHADVAVPAADRARLEHLCRYLLRPAVAQGRLRLLDDVGIVLTLKTAWTDDTRHLVFEPLTLLEKLAALTSRPRINLVLDHGVLAPNAGWRARGVAYGTPPGETPVAASVSAHVNADPAAPKPRHWAWAHLMRRGPGIHHVTFKVPSLDEVCARAEARGYTIVARDDSDPAWMEAFLHPRQALGIVAQFAEERAWGPPRRPYAG